MSIQPLDKQLRKQLENTIITARNVAETAARSALNRLCVGNEKPGEHLNDEMRQQRNKLRAHGRQIGDIRKDDGHQSIDHLAHEMAYEHWHRMLFARFLAENNLLIYEDGVTPLSIQECFELAEDEDDINGWELAGQYASVMLPQIFRTENPVLKVSFSPEHQKELEHLLEALHSDTFQAQDSLGWVYQYWQAQKKEEINKSGNKIGADELPAVTQLFTEPYMVSFLLDNSLGAWWVSHYPQYKAILPFEYLRYAPEHNEDEDAEYKETEIPAAGTFEQWPKQLSELKMLDPCCGSGHFLVATLLMLVPMRMKAENLTADEAIEKVLSQNIHGLELDKRCVEIAAFAVALEAWRFPESSHYRQLPSLNIAWVGQSIKAKKEDWLSLAGDDSYLYQGLEALYNTFKDAPILGSLIDPSKAVTENIFNAGFVDLKPLLNQALQQFEVDDNKEAAIAAKGLTLAADLLSKKYALIATNVPYLSRGKQCKKLQDFIEHYYSTAKGDLANVFLERCLELNTVNGVTQMVMPQNWLFLGSYKKQREHLLKAVTWDLLARLGSGAFDTISGEVVNVILLTLTKSTPKNQYLLKGIDASKPKIVQEKVEFLKSGELSVVSQALQLDNPDVRITLESTTSSILLSNYATSRQGISPADTSKYGRKYWEVSREIEDWYYWHGTTSATVKFSGRESILWFGEGLKKAIADGKAYLRGDAAFGHKGIAISPTGRLFCTIYTGEYFDDNVQILVPEQTKYIAAIWAYCSSEFYNTDVREIDQALKVRGALVKVPFDLKYWTKIAQQKYPNGLPKPYSEDPTQWIFHGHPSQSEAPLQVAVARLLGYQWPAESDKDMELSDQAKTWIKKCETLSSYVDDDGIVCLPPIRGEKSADERLEVLLMAAYGQDWKPSLRNKLLEEVKCKGKTLAFWLRDKFFEQHCKLFQNRPFIWQVWDGLPDGFSALVNYHQLNRQNLERLIYTYLGDWIRTQEHGIKENSDGAEIRLQAAQTLQAHLKSIHEGEAPYDIFIRWKSLTEQSIGWNPDINDGVRLNIRPFMSVPDVGKKEAGILRYKPNIKWNKDRGKDVESAPWFQLGLEYNESEGSRINDHHLTLNQKELARND